MTEARTIEVIEAGVVSYGNALDWQRQLAEDRIARRLDHDVLLFVPPASLSSKSSVAAT